MASALSYNTMVYADIDPRKKAFIFELDNVLYPEKDFFLQVYYLFATYLEYAEQFDAKEAVALMQKTYIEQGPDKVYDVLSNHFKLDPKYRTNFAHLLVHAQLPLKLLLFENMLMLLQEIVVDRKHLFLVTNGNPAMQLNKIKYTDWNGLDKYLVCYFAQEIKPKPEPDVLLHVLKAHNLQRRDVVMIGETEADAFAAEAAGVDYISVENFLTVH